MIRITRDSWHASSRMSGATRSLGLGASSRPRATTSLLTAHPEAFADHAAEFWLAAGADPVKALHLARMNFEVRQTPRARDLLSRGGGGCGLESTLTEDSGGQ